ncbi:MAG: hypothetical protein ABIJ84_03330 [bacterium]
MEIIDKRGYLELALRYIERNIISGRGLQKIAKKAGVTEDLLKSLSLSLKKFSEKQFFTALKERIEEIHSSLSGATAEVSAVDISIEKQENAAFVFLNIVFDIVIDGEQEDEIKINAKIFSKNNMQIQ